ncbi:cyclase family protein [Streptomyces sp. NPDC101151]|uniref:cyclase family protein n=1 Tax=Streptomyces sp. NPDC101151 TaxID=3366115 RepID=UPI003815DC10
MDEDEVTALFERCSNRGRWGADDELGTLNYITEDKRRRAAALVRTGRSVSLARDLSTVQSPVNPQPVLHLMTHDPHRPATAALDYLGLHVHGLATHIDAVAHIHWEGACYNGRDIEEILTPQGLAFGSVHAQRGGIFTRGVLLDIAQAREVEWLARGDVVTTADLDRAQARQDVRVESGDAVLVRVGLQAREAVEGPQKLADRAGLDVGCVTWLHHHEAALYGGDCIEALPSPHPRLPLPLHQIGLAAMGLTLLDWPLVEQLSQICRELGTWEFLIVIAPLPLPGGTGSPVNPLCLF